MSKRFPDVDWWCDRCNAYLNSQIGFDDHKYTWKCTECRHKNSISRDNIYESYGDYWHQNNKNEDTSKTDDYDYSFDTGTEDDNEDPIAGAVATFLMLGFIIGARKAAPYVNQLWHDKAIPNLKKIQNKITGKPK